MPETKNKTSTNSSIDARILSDFMNHEGDQNSQPSSIIKAGKEKAVNLNKNQRTHIDIDLTLYSDYMGISRQPAPPERRHK